MLLILKLGIKNNNIKLIDMSDGIIIDYYHLYIHKYFSFLWIFGEKVVDRALKECNINDNLFVKELSVKPALSS